MNRVCLIILVSRVSGFGIQNQSVSNGWRHEYNKSAVRAVHAVRGGAAIDKKHVSQGLRGGYLNYEGGSDQTRGSLLYLQTHHVSFYPHTILFLRIKYLLYVTFK